MLISNRYTARVSYGFLTGSQRKIRDLLDFGTPPSVYQLTVFLLFSS